MSKFQAFKDTLSMNIIKRYRKKKRFHEISKKQVYFKAFMYYMNAYFILTVNMLYLPKPITALIIPIIYFTYSNEYINGILSSITVIIYAACFFPAKLHDFAGIEKYGNCSLMFSKFKVNY
ncbi:MAG TPA: hypothetical protein DCM73_02985 [Clostridiales bacterium]|nr:hypothetical protein [Clostridiales bacterium]